MTKRITDNFQSYLEAIGQLERGDYAPNIAIADSGKEKQLGLALRKLAQSLEKRYRELKTLDQITLHINAGLLLDEILEEVYEGFLGIIPYNRIGFSLIEADGEIVQARWEKSDQPVVHLKRNHWARLEGSSLQTIIETGKPRIINDLVEYLKKEPSSRSTKLIVAEGIRSSLTCPLIVNGIPVGFMFFSSAKPNTYTGIHIEIFQKIAAQLSVIIEKGRLVSELAEQKSAIERQHQELRQLYLLQEEYIEQVAHVTQAALEVEEGKFAIESLDDVGKRADALGNLARVFQSMAREVDIREKRLTQQVEKLRVEIDEIRRKSEAKGIMETDFFRDLKQKAQQMRSEMATEMVADQQQPKPDGGPQRTKNTRDDDQGGRRSRSASSR